MAELNNDDPDTFRMMISTDNHLGFAEKDEVRGDDSFAAFEEMLYLARKFHCDTVLLGGDLFHENRPSRRCLHRTMEILRKYAMGPDPVRVQSLSGAFNFQDPNYAVHLPVFSIHGNHDDPSRDQGAKDLLAALDLLSVSNLVNYFGRQDDIDRVEVSPLLLQKGTTKIALYGLGSIREERLNRLWTKDKVRFLKAEEEGFFNMFVLHQNRDVGRGTKNCVQESMIPPWMDVVLWGHEHECLIDWVESVVGTFRISQPGSSVATSLCAGEASRKKVGILDIRGQQFRLNALPLTQVRSFVTTEVILKGCRANLDPEDPNVEKKISQYLVEQAQVMVLNAREEHTKVLEDAKKLGNDAGDDNCPTKFKLINPQEVLVRIRVEHSGFATINNQRFGANFIGDIANLHDILLFHRQKTAKLASKVKKNNMAPVEPEDLERTDMVDLVKEFLTGPDDKLKLFGEKTLSEALEECVDKSRTSAIQETADEQLEKKQKLLFTQKGSSKAADIDESLNSIAPVDNSAVDESSMMEEESVREPAAKTAKKRKAPQKPSPKAASSFEESSDEEVEVVEKPKPKPRTKRTAAKRKVAYSAMDDDIESDDDFGSSTKAKKTKAAPKSRAKARNSTAKKPRRRFDSDDEDEEEASEIAANWGSAATQSQL